MTGLALANTIQEAVGMAETSGTVYMAVERISGSNGLDEVAFRSKEMGDPTLRPTLTVDYYLP